MALPQLLRERAETFISSHLAILTGRGRATPLRMTTAMMQTIRDQFESRVRTLSPNERAEFRKIAEAVDQAQANARRLDNRANPTRPSTLKPGEVGRLPGTGRNGEGLYTYTLRVRTADRSADGRNSFLILIQDSELLQGSQVRARALEQLDRGTEVTRFTYRNANPSIILPDGIQILSVYRGSLNAA